MPGRLNNAVNGEKKFNLRSLPKKKFTLEEDKRLIKIVKRYGEYDWELICENMPGRNPRQCKERYLNYLSPKVNNNPWTEEEDKLLLKKRNDIGPKWVRISKFFKGRSDTQIKNRYMILQRRIKLEQEAETLPEPCYPKPNHVDISWENMKKHIEQLQKIETQKDASHDIILNNSQSDSTSISLNTTTTTTNSANDILKDDEIDLWEEAFRQCCNFENYSW
ncbi:Myb-like DNA-binding domain containing protein [Tritrichomonas foetus]|uniref:Myb-like DNA-binding domain containing protein n=1 Tax=Tritrichomonas foetus TaxID=1144522 RepID=A0A1J4KSN7_9EUKA|nr:Myb-like DNA-binding domain containing protein [Tritrichomonas foetus]|eukprot:OHT14303.1 Myb-like DNA-binding domain containing protein [Tritrichomonas foetus]